MNRIRTIKPEIRRNRKIADCGLLATLLSRDLITHADDQGRFHASAREIKAECLPYFDTLKTADVEKALLALADPSVGFIELYEVGSERYGWMPGWFRHQQLKSDRITWSELPPPPSYRPQMMSKALHARWLHDASAGELPERGDGKLAESQGSRGGASPEPHVSNLEPDRSHSGDVAEESDSDLEPRARRRAGADRTGPDQDPERNGTEQRERRHPSPPESSPVTPMPVSPEVQRRAAELEEGCSGILARPLRGTERDLVFRWASTLRRDGQLVPVAEILEVARRKMGQPTPDGTPPVNLAWCADDVAALARYRPRDALGAAGERLTPNSILARQIEEQARHRAGGGQ